MALLCHCTIVHHCMFSMDPQELHWTYLGNWGCDHIGHRPYRPQPYQPQQDDIGHSKKPYRPHGKSISATTISAKTISATKDIGHKIYAEFIWRHRDDTSRFRIVRMVNLNVKDYVSHVMSCWDDDREQRLYTKTLRCVLIAEWVGLPCYCA